MTTKKRPATQGVVRDIAISPDGTRLIYTAGGQSPLMVRTIDRLDTFPLAGTAQARAPFSSPDGRWVGFFTGGDAGGELKKCRSPADPPSRCAESTAMDLLLKGDASLVSFNMTESDCRRRCSASRIAACSARVRGPTS